MGYHAEGNPPTGGFLLGGCYLSLAQPIKAGGQYKGMSMRIGKILITLLLVVCCLPFVLWFSRDLWLLPGINALLKDQPIQVTSLTLNSPLHIAQASVDLPEVGSIDLKSLRYFYKEKTLSIAELKAVSIMETATEAESDNEAPAYKKLPEQLAFLRQQLDRLPSIEELKAIGLNDVGIKAIELKTLYLSDQNKPNLKAVLGLNLAVKEAGWQLKTDILQPVKAQLALDLTDKTIFQLDLPSLQLPESLQNELWLRVQPLSSVLTEDFKLALFQPDAWQGTKLNFQAELSTQELVDAQINLQFPQLNLPVTSHCNLGLQSAKKDLSGFKLQFNLLNERLDVTPENLPELFYKGDCLNPYLPEGQQILASNSGRVSLASTRWQIDGKKGLVKTDSVQLGVDNQFENCRSCQDKPLQPKILSVDLKNFQWQKQALQTGIDLTLKTDYLWSGAKPKPETQNKKQNVKRDRIKDTGTEPAKSLKSQRLELQLATQGQLKLLSDNTLVYDTGNQQGGHFQLKKLDLGDGTALLDSHLSASPKVKLDLTQQKWQINSPWQLKSTLQHPQLKQNTLVSFAGQIAGSEKKQTISAVSNLNYLPIQLELTRQGDVLSGQFYSHQPLQLAEWVEKVHLPEGIELNQGTLGLKGDLNFYTGSAGIGNKGKQVAVLLEVENLAAQYQGFQVKGLNTQLPLSLQGERLVLEASEVDIKQAFTGVELTDISFNVEGQFSQGLPVAQLSQGKGALFDGGFSFDQVQYPPEGQDTLMSIHNLDLQKLVNLDESQQITITGKVSGRLPIKLYQDGAELNKGLIYTSLPGEIILTHNQAWQAMLKQNEILAGSLKHLNHLHYSNLDGELTMSRHGELAMQIAVKGENRAERQPVNLNFTVEQNIFTLLKALRLSDQISQTLDQSVQRKY